MKKVPEAITTKCCIRILAYIRVHYGSNIKVSFPAGPIQHDHPERFTGYSCDVTVEIESVINGQTFSAIVDHYGDGIMRENLTEARYYVLTTTGILPDVIPENLLMTPPETGEWSQVVAALVREFAPTLRLQQEVERESVIKSIGEGGQSVPIGAIPHTVQAVRFAVP
jgi:hypothetical protein